MGGYAEKWVRPFRSYGTIKSVESNKWFDESSRLIEWFLHCDSDWMTLGLTTSLLCIFSICWVSTAVILVKNDVLLLMPRGTVLELGFPNFFKIKAWLSVEKFFPVSCNTQKNMRNEQKPKCSLCMSIEPQNFKILAFFLYGYHTPQLKNIAIPAIALTPRNFKLLPTR